MINSASSFRLIKNLTILGAPGSGKGFYGRLLAQSWGVQLLTTSTILRLHAQNHPKEVELDSGKLVDCKIVSDIMLDYLRSLKQQTGQKQNPCYILDGFPRTALQLELMHQWPSHLQVHAALHLDIPDQVCLQKSLGRRHCNTCQHSVNVANVQYGRFDLPPTIPKECTKGCHAGSEDWPETDWTRRKDDTEEIILERLKLHHEHYDPIVEYYRKERRLLQVTPYRGFRDLDLLKRTSEEWLLSFPLPAHS